MPETSPVHCAVRTIDLCKWYGRPETRVHALRSVTLDVALGERIALLGKSGSGKSTLLNLIGGLDRPSSGRMEVVGQDLSQMASSILARHRLSTVGMVFQSFNLIASKTALENVMLPLIFSGVAPVTRRKTATQMLEAVGLGQRLNHLPTELSGGEQQRVALARSLVNRPRILLADEPTGNLDSSTSDEVIQLLLDHVRAAGSTLILITHDEDLARRSTDRIIRLHDGQVVS